MTRRQLFYPDDWHETVTAEAEKRGMNWSEFVRHAIEQQLPKTKAKRLSTPRSPGEKKDRES